MIRNVKTELMKLRRYSVVWIGVAAMLSVVLLTWFMATANDGTVHTLENFSSNVIWNNYSIMFPASITLIAGCIGDREPTDDTLKNILIVPIIYQWQESQFVPPNTPAYTAMEPYFLPLWLAALTFFAIGGLSYLVIIRIYSGRGS